MTTATKPVDTKRTAEFRTLKFTSLADVRREVERLGEAGRAGTLRCGGNWTAGQTFGHLASWISYPYDGYPPELANPPWIIKMILKMKKGTLMRGPMPRGVWIPKLKGGTMGTEPLPLEEGLSRLLRELARLEAAPPPRPNPVFGPLTHDEWKTLHVRHAELHLGFLHPPATAG